MAEAISLTSWETISNICNPNRLNKSWSTEHMTDRGNSHCPNTHNQPYANSSYSTTYISTYGAIIKVDCADTYLLCPLHNAHVGLWSLTPLNLLLHTQPLQDSESDQPGTGHNTACVCLCFISQSVNVHHSHAPILNTFTV